MPLNSIYTLLLQGTFNVCNLNPDSLYEGLHQIFEQGKNNGVFILFLNNTGSLG